jgi:hypothetical protein
MRRIGSGITDAPPRAQIMPASDDSAALPADLPTSPSTSQNPDASTPA